MIPFSPETITFLKDLRDNNNKRWFEANRRVYETYLLDPFRDLAEHLAPVMTAINHKIEVRPQIGKAISRIHRDTRFSKSKLPYKTTMWLDYHYHLEPMSETPGFFFYIEPETWGFGMGFWQASPAAMDVIRGYLSANPVKSEKILKKLGKTGLFTLGGESYKRPRVADLPPITLELCNHKTFYYIHNENINRRLFSSNLYDEIATGFKLLAPLYRNVAGISRDQT
jgi:uncharacterized protein (TIGR02453 family)